uniref:Cytochrome P450 n=1 Tax=Stomoxys calcitrans TaxID=35570 RepID=A0A1I8NTI0_STOCA
MYLLVFLFVFFIWCYKSHASKKYMRHAVRNLQGPFAIPLLGCIQEISRLRPKNITSSVASMFAKYGKLMKLWAFNRLLIVSADIEFNEQILASPTHITKVAVYNMLHPWLGIGLLTSDGKKWHTRRKIITPTFHFKILEEFLEVFDHQSTILLQCLEEKADGRSTIDIYPLICLFTLDVIVETAMGTKVNAQTSKSCQYASAVHEMTELLAMRFVRLHLNNELVFTILHPFKKLRQTQLIQIMHNFTKSVIEERRILLQQNQHKSLHAEANEDMGCKKRSAFLDVLLQATVNGQPLSDEDIREEVDTFMFEGHDTTASALSFTLHLLARHPRVQNKILAEVQQICGNSEDPLTLMNLNEMKYLECVIRESLRLYPSVPIFGRQFKEDFAYTHSTLGDGVIPAGSELYIWSTLVLRDPKRYPNPSEFVPERFEDVDEKINLSTSPFSAGPRNCIGQKFAMYEMKITLMKIVRTFELLPLGEDVQPIPNIVMCSENGMQLGLRKRKA